MQLGVITTMVAHSGKPAVSGTIKLAIGSSLRLTMGVVIVTILSSSYAHHSIMDWHSIDPTLPARKLTCAMYK